MSLICEDITIAIIIIIIVNMIMEMLQVFCFAHEYTTF